MDWACGGGVPAGLGVGEWVGEHQRRVGVLAAGLDGREEGRRRELHGSLGMGGANGRRRRLWTPRRARLSAWSREGSRGGGRRPVCAARGGERARRGRERVGEKVHGTARLVRRRGTTTAVLGVRARRWRRVAMRSFRRDRDGAAGGTARARPVAIGLRVQRRQGREREEKRE